MKTKTLLWTTLLATGTTILNQGHAQIAHSHGNMRLELVSWTMYCTAEYLDVSGNHLFVSSNAFVTFDVSDKQKPSEVSCLRPLEAGWPRSTAVHGNYAYVAWSEHGIRVLDISDKSRPRIIADNFETSYSYANLKISYPYLFAFAQKSVSEYYLVVIDISNPANPTLAGTFDLLSLPGGLSKTHYPYTFMVDGNYVYLTFGPREAGGAARLHILDVSIPSRPLHRRDLYIGEVRLGAGLREKPHLALDKKDNYVYVAGPFLDPAVSDLKIIEASNPQNPSVAASWFGRINSANIDISGNHAYVTDRDGRLYVLDITNPLSPVIRGNVRLPIPEYYAIDFNVKADGNYVYMHHWDFYAVFVVDASDPNSPTVSSTIPFGHALNDIGASGSHLYAAVWDHLQFYAIDMSTPESPAIVNRAEVLGYGWGIEVKKNFAYLAMGAKTIAGQTGGLAIFDISDPDAPIRAGYNAPLSGVDHDVEVYVDTTARHAYVVVGEPINWEDGNHKSDHPGLRIVNVAVPSQPTQAGYWGLPSNQQGKDVHKVGNYAYLAAAGGLFIIDVSNPSDPTLAGTWGPGEKIARAVYVKGRYAYLAYANGFYVLDVGTPSAPVKIGSYEVGAQCNDVVVDSAYAFVVSSDALIVLDVSNPAAPTLVDSVRGIFSISPSYLAVTRPYIFVATNGGGIYTFHFSNVTGIDKEKDVLPNALELRQNYPNPFNPQTTIMFSLPRREYVTLKVFDGLGREVTTLFNGELDGGRHTIVFDAKGLPSGVYFCRLQAGKRFQQRAMEVIK
jgi:hypothetical protein